MNASREQDESQQINQPQQQQQGGVFGGFFSNKLSITNVVTNTMDKINNLFQKEGPSIEDIQHVQQCYLIMQMVQHLIFILILTFFLFLNVFAIFNNIPLVIQVGALLLFFLILLMMCLEANVIKEAPANILAFFGHFLIKVVFLVIISISYPFSHIEIAIGILFLDFVLILLWFKYDQKKEMINCFLVSENIWRIVFTVFFQGILVGLLLGLDSILVIILWFIIISIIYFLLLLQIQMVQIRHYLIDNNNKWYLGSILFDSDIVFPCSLIKYHCWCGSSNDQVIKLS